MVLASNNIPINFVCTKILVRHSHLCILNAETTSQRYFLIPSRKITLMKYASLPFLRNLPNCKSPKFGGIKLTFFARRMNNIRVMKYLHIHKQNIIFSFVVVIEVISISLLHVCEKFRSFQLLRNDMGYGGTADPETKHKNEDGVENDVDNICYDCSMD